MRCFAMFQLGVIGGTDPALPGPAASPLHDALYAVAAAAHAAIAGHGFGPADLWPPLGVHDVILWTAARPAATTANGSGATRSVHTAGTLASSPAASRK
jgi:hypothetical protein